MSATPDKVEPTVLDQIGVASPCPASWEAMRGNDQVRFCDECQSNVYNLSALSADEAETFVQQAEGRVCVRLYRRADGTLINRDCPVGLRAVRLQLARAVAGVAALATLLLCGAFWARGGSLLSRDGSLLSRDGSLLSRDGGRQPAPQATGPTDRVAGWIGPPPPKLPVGAFVEMGLQCVVPGPVAATPPATDGPPTP